MVPEFDADEIHNMGLLMIPRHGDRSGEKASVQANKSYLDPQGVAGDHASTYFTV